MKRILMSAGLFATVATALQGAYAPGLSDMEKAKPWSVSASVRGFYDDNYTTSPSSVSRSSFGFEVSPSASLNIPLDQTFFGASYLYSLKYYEDRSGSDQSHQFNAKLEHAFSERYKLNLNETFVIAQEPEVLNPSGTVIVPLRLNGNNLRNTGGFDFTAQMSELLGLQIGYQNNYYDYKLEGINSYSALLDRDEHLANFNLRYQLQRPTVLIAGYQFGWVQHTSDDLLLPAPGVLLPSSIRNDRSHYVYVGVDHSFTQQLNASVRLGGRYTDYYNEGGNNLSPYADGNLTYTYAPGSYLQVGVRHDRSQTDVITTLDQEATTAYISLTHRITALLTGNIMGEYQHASFNESSFGGVPGTKGSDNYFVASVNLAYRIDRAGHWMAETGYNYDKLNSDVPNRAYTRNRAYIGLRATY